ncbi:MAG: HupE/UreJ family protein, partial [Nevskia sp.]|uniref:HupE/UreJ family protein n=1 Tax=Nevskia sp. TaxID=1929292 RepID=UPI004037447B
TLLAGAAGAAQAHTGHGTSSLFEGLVHPFGPDHLLAMVAVGVWSVSALPASRAWQGPATFLLALIVSATLGMLGFTVPYLEHGVSLSVVLFGGMLQHARRATVSPANGLGLIAAAASLHGLAHGAETPESGFAGYAVGFLFTTARLLGLSRRRLHELVHGQRAMSPDTAIRCARVFRVDAGFWLAQQAAWDS